LGLIQRTTPEPYEMEEELNLRQNLAMSRSLLNAAG
jgi:hypothetical protein